MTTRTLPGPRTSWLSILINWLIALVALAVVVTIVLVCAASGYYELNRTTGDDVETMIAAELPQGATTDQLNRFLQAHAFTETATRPITSNDTKVIDRGVPEGTTTITGTLLNDGYAILLRDVEVWFFLNAEGLLDGYLVFEVGR
jgi:hypothetical protein